MADVQLSLLPAAPQAQHSARLRHFHARDESPAEALAGEARAKRQEAIILGWFQRLAEYDRDTRATPSLLEAAMALMGHKWPLTSIRRSLSNLTRRGLLQKHASDRRMGPRGARECCWSLA